MPLSIPRSFVPFGKPQGGLASRIALPVLGSLTGAAATWAVYSFTRNGPALLSGLKPQWRGWVTRAKRSWTETMRLVGSPRAAEWSPEDLPPKADLPDASPRPEGQLSQEGQPGRDWIPAMLEAMRKEPREFGFAKPDWSAPLLGQYLERHHGRTIPVNRIREALKESGFEWHATRYRKAHR